jgi:hypothetical protein
MTAGRALHPPHRSRTTVSAKLSEARSGWSRSIILMGSSALPLLHLPHWT